MAYRLFQAPLLLLLLLQEALVKTQVWRRNKKPSRMSCESAPTTKSKCMSQLSPSTPTPISTDRPVLHLLWPQLHLPPLRRLVRLPDRLGRIPYLSPQLPSCRFHSTKPTHSGQLMRVPRSPGFLLFPAHRLFPPTKLRPSTIRRPACHTRNSL